MAKQGKVKVYETSNSVYLGTREDNTITGMRLDVSRQVTQDDFAEYLKTQQIGEFVEVEVGLSDAVTTRKLTRREKLDFKMVQAEFDEAKDMAQDQLVNDVFDRFRGKK